MLIEELHQSRFVLLGSVSILVRNRNVFLALMLIISALKLVFSLIVPASYDLRDIIMLFGSGHNPVGPWIALYPPLYNQSAYTLGQLAAWSSTTPSSMSFSLRLVSLLFRLPVFAFDVATATALYYAGKRMGSAVGGRWASLLWFVNPYSLFSIELLGVPDVVATFLIVMTFLFLISNRHVVAGVFLGLGVWVKFYPILLLPPLLLYAHANGVSWRQIISVLYLTLVGLLGYIGWILPFGLTYLTHYTPVTQPLPFVAGENVVNGAALWLILFYCLLGLFVKKAKTLLSLLLLTLLVYYAFSNPYPQYLIWAMPLMALDVTLAGSGRRILFGISYALAFVQWFLLSSAFLTPSGYSLLMIPLGGNNVPWYSQAIGRFLDSPLHGLILPIVSSSFYASVLIYAADLTRSLFGIGRSGR
jgi:hypothetical protein